MLNNKDYIYQSLVNHIYFSGTVRSFCTAIGLTFFKNNQSYIDKAIEIGYKATDIINKAISYTDKDLASEILKQEVYITKYTKEVDLLTEKLFTIDLKINVDNDIKLLENKKDINYTDDLIEKVNILNNEGLSLVSEFNNFVKDIKTKIDNGELFSYLYPDFFNYMFEEISVYGRDLERLNSKKDYSDFYINELKYYFNELLKKSAEYIRGFLDTTHQDIFDIASFYVNSFDDLTEKYLKGNNSSNLILETEKLVDNYKKFISNNIEKVLNSEIYFITPPIVLDNFLTNVNAYLYIINNIYKKN